MLFYIKCIFDKQIFYFWTSHLLSCRRKTCFRISQHRINERKTPLPIKPKLNKFWILNNNTFSLRMSVIPWMHSKAKAQSLAFNKYVSTLFRSGMQRHCYVYNIYKIKCPSELGSLCLYQSWLQHRNAQRPPITLYRVHCEDGGKFTNCGCVCLRQQSTMKSGTSKLKW